MSGLQQKLYNYEQAPPPGAWEKIADSLDESHIADEFPATLYNAESTPPLSAWEKIAGALDNEHATVIAMPRRSTPLFRYAAAAIIIGMITFGVIKLTGSKEPNESGSSATVSTKKDQQTESNSGKTEQNIAATHPEDQATGEEDDPIARAIDPKSTVAKKTRKAFAAIDDPNVEPVYAYNEHSQQRLADRYFMLLTPNGVIRMSKKLGDLVCCVSGQEQDEDCKDQLKKWQEKIASSPVTPSPGNFMDILSLVSSLNENEL